MPLKRTPPSSPATIPKASSHNSNPPCVSAPAPCASKIMAELTVPALHHASSEPNLLVNNQRKRKHSLYDDDILSSFMIEMRNMFAQFKEDHDKKVDKICNAVEDIKSSLDFLANRLDTLQERIVKLESALQLNDLCLRTLEDKLENLERSARSTCLEIRNIPVANSETKASLLDTLIHVGKILKVPIQQTEVKDIFRLRSKDQANRTIIVELTSSLLKEKIITMVRGFNKGSSKLTTDLLHIPGPRKPIFISENLTPKMKRLFYLSREFAKGNDFKFCWVSHGKVFLRKRENGPLIRIAAEHDLEKIQELK